MWAIVRPRVVVDKRAFWATAINHVWSCGLNTYHYLVGNDDLS